jgi:hypothetical protein
MSKEMHEMRALCRPLHIFCICRLLAKDNLGRASNCHTGRQKTKREDREVTIEAMLADGG